MSEISIGSLFDGIGGFPLVAQMYGIKALWASEIELQPINITKRHFPDMAHLGDVTKINGAEIAPVDIITFGSPCQDLSVAGKRAGLDGARSGLFMEAIRIIKEMRVATYGKYPTYAVWENVPGAFSSNKGEDFRVVLEELASIQGNHADISRPEKGKWSDAGLIVGEGYSLGWRVFDAQYMGVPQRRRRIYAVLALDDFTGRRAGEILFKPESERRNITPSCAPWKRIAGKAESGALGVKCLNPHDSQTARVYDASGVWHSLTANENGGQSRDAVLTYPDDISMVAFAQNQRDEVRDLQDIAGTLAAEPGVHQQTYVAAFMGGQGAKAGGIAYSEQTSPTLKSAPSGSNTVPTVACYGICSDASNSMKSSNPHSGIYEADTARTLDCNGGSPACNQGGIAIVEPSVYCLQGNGIDRADTAGCNGKGWTEDVRYTLNTIDRHAVYDARGNGGSEIAPTMTGDHNGHMSDYTALCVGNGQADQTRLSDKVGALNCMHDQQTVMIRGKADEHEAVGFTATQFAQYAEGVGTCRANGGDLGGDSETLVTKRYTVRRLTPLECERLQGYPDEYTRYGADGKEISDAARYKALGNSVALPCVDYVIRGIKDMYDVEKGRCET